MLQEFLRLEGMIYFFFFGNFQLNYAHKRMLKKILQIGFLIKNGRYLKQNSFFLLISQLNSYIMLTFEL